MAGGNRYFLRNRHKCVDITLLIKTLNEYLKYDLFDVYTHIFLWKYSALLFIYYIKELKMNKMS